MVRNNRQHWIVVKRFRVICFWPYTSRISYRIPKLIFPRGKRGLALIRIRYNANQCQEAYSSPDSSSVERAVVKIKYSATRCIFNSLWSNIVFRIDILRQSVRSPCQLFIYLFIFCLCLYTSLQMFYFVTFLHREEQLSSTIAVAISQWLCPLISALPIKPGSICYTSYAAVCKSKGNWQKIVDVGVGVVYHEYDYKLNWTTRSLTTS